ncbi:MAG: glycosyltransferase family 39 protein [Deltaproteobacteria bacterium]|nr:glycosyltransferase family 39 protein [Deltaproteobacteria bacterium]
MPVACTGLLDRSWFFWGALLAATLVGAALRLHGLDSPSLWVDEFFTIARSGREPLHWTSAFGYAPTRATLAWHGAELGRIGLDNIREWQALGVTERAARLGPCWIGIVSIPILGLAARSIVGNGAAAVATVLLALAPWHVYWSQTARYYTTEFLFANLFLMGFAWGASRGSRPVLAAAALAAVLAYLSHPTALVVVGICGGVLALGWWLRVPGIAFGRAAGCLTAVLVSCAGIYGVRELAGGEWGGLGSFARQGWDPSLAVMILGTAYRVEMVVLAVGLLSAVWLVRGRDPVGSLMAAVAVLTPFAFFVLKFRYPVAPRYFFVCLFAWLLLAGIWSAEVDRRLAGPRSGIAGLGGALVLATAVAFSAFLYAYDGAGARERWRDGFDHVARHASAADSVYSVGGRFQASFYLERDIERLPKGRDSVAALPPGSWVVQRTRGGAAPRHADLLALEARYPIGGKPWSWVVNVLRVPRR